MKRWRKSLDPPEGLTERVRERRSTHSQLAERNQNLSSLTHPATHRHGRATMSKSNRSPLATVSKAYQGAPVFPKGLRAPCSTRDPTALGPGDVLVAPSTDPSWTPLFVPAGGVVVDVGAALSHAIIVSRELGIPCVVSATNATRRIRDGARVRVDGNTGVVTVLD